MPRSEYSPPSISKAAADAAYVPQGTGTSATHDVFFKSGRPWVDAMAYGVVGNGVVDDTAAIQAAIDATADYGVLFFPTGLGMKITATVQVYNRKGLHIWTPGGAGSSTSIGGTATRFLWNGAVGGTMVDINCSRGVIFEGFGLEADAVSAATSAAVGIKLAQNLALGNICSDNIIRRCTVHAQRPSTSATFIGIMLGAIGDSNCERLRVENCAIAGSTAGSTATGIGVQVTHSNVKVTQITGTVFDQLGTGVHIINGGTAISSCLFTNNKQDIDGGASDGISIQNCDVEGSCGFYTGSGGATVSSFLNNRLAFASGAWTAFDVSSGVPNVLILTGNVFDTNTSITALTGQGDGGNSRLVSRGNIYPGAIPNFKSFSRGVSSFADSAKTGGIIDPLIGGIDTTLVTSDAWLTFLDHTGTIIQAVGLDTTGTMTLGATVQAAVAKGLRRATKVGGYMAPCSVAAPAAVAMSDRQVEYVPIDFDRAVTIDRIGVKVTGAGASRTVTDGVLNSTTTITSATASFSGSTDVGKAVSGTGIPADTYIQSVTNSTTVVLTRAASATNTGVSLTFSAVIRLGIFKDNNGPGGRLADFGAVDTSTTGYKELTVSQASGAGRWWLAACAQGGTPSINYGISDTATRDDTSVLTDFRVSGYKEAGVAGSLPSTATPGNGGENAPRILVRVQ